MVERAVYIMMKRKNKLKGAEAFGVKVVTNKSIDKLTEKILFPKKMEEANRIAKQVNWDDFRSRLLNK